jgi:hypothetical protein
MGTYLTQHDLLPGEFHIRTQPAKLLTVVKDDGLSRFAVNGAHATLLRSTSKEAMRGKAYLTNYRILFKSRAFNPARGFRSIWLPNITAISGAFRTVHVATDLQDVTLVMWFKKPFAADAEEARRSVTEAMRDKIRQGVLHSPEAIGVGLRTWATAEAIQQLCLGGPLLHEAIESLSRWEALSLLEIAGLFRDSQVVTEPSPCAAAAALNPGPLTG